MLLSRTLAILSLAASSASAYNAFLGCVVSGSGNVPSSATATGTTRASCQAKCSTVSVLTIPAVISFWSAQGSCYCGTTMALSGAVASTLYHQGDSYGNCLNGQDLAADYITSGLRYEGSSSSALPGPALAPFSVLSPERCINQCSGQYATATTIPSGTGYTCSCYSSAYTSLAQTPSQSGPSAYNIYSTSVPGASIAQRKRSERIEAEKKLRGNTPCPRGLDACVVEGTSEYECIDTTNELESCGGCLAGHFESNRPAGGANCAALPGVAKHGVMCSDSQCVVSRCRFGWKLVNGRCEREKTKRKAEARSRM